jgi:hypothetical protein
MKKKAQQVARANAHRPSFFAHDSRARNSILALGERGSSLTLGEDSHDALVVILCDRHGRLPGRRYGLRSIPGADVHPASRRTCKHHNANPNFEEG